jgi:hypothetical protein
MILYLCRSGLRQHGIVFVVQLTRHFALSAQGRRGQMPGYFQSRLSALGLSRLRLHRAFRLHFRARHGEERDQDTALMRRRGRLRSRESIDLRCGVKIIYLSGAKMAQQVQQQARSKN